ncbi:MAG: serine hydrolase [Bacteroidales bacterium]|nr:MAG: serine hydrolase [Bacteroidales bacterium]
MNKNITVLANFIKNGIAVSLFITLFGLSNYLFAQEEQQKTLKELNEYYTKALADWDVPGMAIAIVKDDSVIFTKGFGVREVGKPEKVDANTIFAIASNTKAFTAAALAILVDEGKVKWDDKVIEYLPWFQLYDPYVTYNMTIRDLLCHRSGLATFSGDLLWFASTYSREEVIRRARFLKPVYGFRERFGYSNIMFIAAGEIVQVVTGKTWDEFTAERIFQPLRMARTNTSTKALVGLDNVAQCHTTFEGKTISIPYLNWDNVAPAGSINSSVNDISRWIKLQLNNGKMGATQIFSPSRSREMWSSNTLQGVSSFSENLFPTTHFKAYALGWGVFDYLGKKVVSHSGGYDGMISYTCLVPEDKLGFVILTNKNSSLYNPLAFKTLDMFLGGKHTDWSAMMLDDNYKQTEMEKKDRLEEELKRVKDSHPTLALNEYAGLYGGELYGNARVTFENGELKLLFVPTPQLNATLKHWQYDTFSIQFPDFPSLPQGKVTFLINASGKVEEMRVDVPNPDFDFTELKFRKFE